MNKKLRYMMLCLSLFAFGCNDWLDVQPKSQVKEEDLFSSESGFRDALTGIYALMGRVETYGGNSTMGFMDMLAQTYSKVDYDYAEKPLKPRLHLPRHYVNARSSRYPFFLYFVTSSYN